MASASESFSGGDVGQLVAPELSMRRPKASGGPWFGGRQESVAVNVFAVHRGREIGLILAILFLRLTYTTSEKSWNMMAAHDACCASCCLGEYRSSRRIQRLRSLFLPLNDS